MRLSILGVPPKPKTNYYAPEHLGTTIAVLKGHGHSIRYHDILETRHFQYDNAVRSIAKAGSAEMVLNLPRDEYFPVEAVQLLDRAVTHKLLDTTGPFESQFVRDDDALSDLAGIYRTTMEDLVELGDLPASDAVLLWSANSDISGILVAAKLIRALDPKLPIVLFGDYNYEHFSPVFRAVLQGQDYFASDVSSLISMDPFYPRLPGFIREHFDLIVHDEGFDVFGDLESWLNRVSSSSGPLECVRSTIVAPDQLPFPDYRDMTSIYKFGQFIFSRGCRYSCSFCERATIWRWTVRYKSPQRVVDEMTHLTSKYSWDWVNWDSQVNADPASAEKCLKAIRDSSIRLTWSGCMRFKTAISDDFVRLLLDTGCYRIDFGFESAAAHVLKEMTKTHPDIQTQTMMLPSFRELQELGLYLILGWPTETLEDALVTHEYLDDLHSKIPNMDVYAGFYTPSYAAKLSLDKFERHGMTVGKVTPESFASYSRVFSRLGTFLGMNYTRGMSRRQLSDYVSKYQGAEFIKASPGSLIGSTPVVA